MAEEGTYDAVRYIRLSNSPNHLLLQARLAVLESGEAALVTGSGMAAISAAILAFVSQGEHLLAQRTLYGGTQSFLDEDAPTLDGEAESRGEGVAARRVCGFEAFDKRAGSARADDAQTFRAGCQPPGEEEVIEPHRIQGQ